MVRQALSRQTPDSVGLTQAKTIRLVSAESPLNLELANVSARFGHDSFLLEPESVTAIVNGFLSH
jgi:homoserine acetyltransferase